MAEEGGDPTDAFLALSRVRAVIEDEPISEFHQRAFENMILDWFAAYETITLVMIAGPAPQLLDTVQIAPNRIGPRPEVLQKQQEVQDARQWRPPPSPPRARRPRRPPTPLRAPTPHQSQTA